MLDLVGNPEDRFSHNEAHIVVEERFVFQAVSYGTGTDADSV